MIMALRRAALATLLAGAVALPATLPAAAQTTDFTDKQKAAIGEFIKDYLLKNPEVIQDALVELDRRQKDAEKVAVRKAIGEFSAALTSPQRNVVLGNPNGDVTLVEFMDYNCTYCKRSVVDMRDLIKSDPKLKVIIRDFPVLGPDSVEASQVAVAVKNQLKGDKYWDFHVKLMESRGRVGKDRAMQVAKEAGVDMARLAKDVDSIETKGIIEESMRIGDALKLQGTPAFIVGNEIVFGAVGVEPLRATVASVRQCGKASC